ncbi:MAG TPA: hypothetical protein VF175_15265 [Lacipirellula sp.]
MRLSQAIVGCCVLALAAQAAFGQTLSNPAAMLAVDVPTGDAADPATLVTPAAAAEPVAFEPLLEKALNERSACDVGAPAQIDCAAPVDHTAIGSPGRASWFGDFELTILHASSVNSSITTLEDDNGLGGRFIFGRENAAGLGLRGRFWDYHMETARQISAFLPYGPTRLELDASRFDFDVYRRFKTSDSSISVGASVSSAIISFERDETFRPLNNPFMRINDYETRHSAGGVGFLVEGRHAFYRSPKHEWSVLARGRWTGLIGETSDSRIGYRISNSNINITEAALGLEYRRKFSAADFLLQCSLEGQAWAIGGVPVGYYNYALDPTPANVNFLGPTVLFGVSR